MTRESPPGLWGKLRQADDGTVLGWLPLEHHCTDVAAVFRGLCELPGPRRALERACGVALTSAHLDRFAVLAFLHDIGKCNRGFQSKAVQTVSLKAGHIRELALFFADETWQRSLLDAIAFADLEGWFTEPEGVLRMLLASVSHHGEPIDIRNVDTHHLPRLWQADRERDPMRDMAGLTAEAGKLYPAAFSTPVSPLHCTAPLQHRFAGLVMLADWLGSHADAFFPYLHGAEDRGAFATRQARKALVTVGLDPRDLHAAARNSQSFSQLFGFEPRGLQKALFRAEPSAVIVAEAETGSGKTEAALGYFHRLLSLGAVDSLYFALPTRVAAREMYLRVLTFARTAFGTDHPPVVLALPGYSQVDGEPPDALPANTHLWHENDELLRRERAWAAERPKRFLAAPLAVGTIDQALLSVMQVKHAHLRAACLDRALLVVDEVHASDTYMRGLLRALLAHHKNAGGHALLLSATLGAEARAELMAPLASAPVPPSLGEAVDLPYPSLASEGSAPIAIGADADTRSKSVRIEPTTHFTRPDALLPSMGRALQAGARVLVVLNTVARVNSLVRAAEDDPQIREYLFTCAGEVCPHHGRFSGPDRQRLDAAVSAALGKNSPATPVLLIGSQTLEQSLDIDADWLVTDLCPMDVLLQRIGRLHRHARPRPDGFLEARCTVLVPEDETLEFLFDSRHRVRPVGGLGRVYPDLRVLRLTRECIGNGVTVGIPADNRALVEHATHGENLARFVDGPWHRHSHELCGTSVAHYQAANSALIAENLSFGDSDLCFRTFDEKLVTRLGLDDRRLQLGRLVTSPFGESIDELPVPGWMARGIAAVEPDGPPTEEDDMIRFRYGGRPFRYTRFGLEQDE